MKDDQAENIPDFELRENDYVLGPRKMGGNAQSIVKGGWLHHTSFLWDYDGKNMEYLTLPRKRPDYRQDRDHSDFLVKLKTIYGTHESSSDVDTTQLFFGHVKSVSQDAFDLKETSINEALSVVKELGGMQTRQMSEENNEDINIFNLFAFFFPSDRMYSFCDGHLTNWLPSIN